MKPQPREYALTAQTTLSRDQVRAFDRVAIEKLGISSVVLMENAGRGCVDVLDQQGIRGPVVICCGSGNNGGDGLVMARHLDLRGYEVRVLLFADPARLSGDARTNYDLVVRLGLHLEVFSPANGSTDDALARLRQELSQANWAVDALLGTGSRGRPKPPYDAVIEQMNAANVNRLAVDVPSGLDCQTGEAADVTFRADHTCTFVSLKDGFHNSAAKPWLGTVHVIDIGVPLRLIDELEV